MKNTDFNIFKLMIILIPIFIVGNFIYNIEYKIHTIDKVISPDGKYILLFQEKGSTFKESSTIKLQVIDNKNKKQIGEKWIEITDDGESMNPNNLVEVQWNDDYIIVVTDRKEQEPESTKIKYLQNIRKGIKS